MTTENKPIPAEPGDPKTEEQVLYSRRTFLASLGKWSKAVIAGAVLGGGLFEAGREAQAAGWINRYGGGGWANRYGGGGWANRYGGGGSGWVNRYGGGGSGWVNRY